MLEVVTSPEAPICPFHPHKWERLLFEASEFNKANKQTNKQETKKRTRNDGIGDTSRLQVSAERGRWSKTNTNLWTRTPSQMKDLWKHFPIYFNSWDLNIRIYQSNIARSYCKWPRRVTTIEFPSNLPRSSADPGEVPPATNFSTTVSILASPAAVPACDKWKATESWPQVLSPHCRIRGTGEKRWDFRAHGWRLMTRLHPGGPSGVKL